MLFNTARDPSYVNKLIKLYLQITLLFMASLVAQLVKNLPAMQETWIRPLGWEDPLEK